MRAVNTRDKELTSLEDWMSSERAENVLSAVDLEVSIQVSLKRTYSRSMAADIFQLSSHF